MMDLVHFPVAAATSRPSSLSKKREVLLGSNTGASGSGLFLSSSLLISVAYCLLSSFALPTYELYRISNLPKSNLKPNILIKPS